MKVFVLSGWAMRPQAFEPLLAALPGITPEFLPADFDAARTPLPADAILLGWSRGAQQAIAATARQTVRALILIAPSPCFVAKDGWPHALAASTVADFRRGFNADPAATLRRFLALQALGDTQRAATLRTLNDCLEAPDTPGLAGGLDALCETDLRDDCVAVQSPCLILHGERDALMPAAASRWLLGELEHADLYVLEGAGHAPHLSRASQCAGLIRSFLERV